MEQKIKNALDQARVFTAANLSELENFRVEFLGKKGIIQELFAQFKSLPPSEKKETGVLLNELKKTVQEKVEQYVKQLSVTREYSSDLDLTLPANHVPAGSRHPISIVRKEIIDIFSRIGFTISEGPEIEDDWHVFSALNFPEEHPARDMQDTFFIAKDPDILLRTHTSSVQVRVMESENPPIRTISPGRVFRNEAISARSHCIFHQIEGLYVDENVSFADLKQTLEFFAKELFGEETKIRLRPSFFPFTEPSGEMDVSCRCKGKGCKLCKNTGWLEVLGCGMVDPNVLKECNIDPVKYTGFAFGMGIERIALLKYDIKDIRLYFENDVRFLNQFSAII
ncbi:MAG: phenylalanine--tRNA ligase subunit alpha [Bacteroidales bacterium]